MTEDERYATGYFNGAVWESASYMRAVLTFVGTSNMEWCLLAVHTTMQRGRYALSPYVQETGKWLYTFKELPDRLKHWHWLKDCTLAPINEELFMDCFV